MPHPSPQNPQARILSAQSGARTRVRFIVMAFLCGLSFLTYFDRVCIVRAQPEIKRDLGLNDSQMGWVLGAFWLAYALFEIPAGWLGDRYGARRTLGRIVIAWSIFTALSGAATGFISLLACRICFGAGEAGAYPGMARVQSRWLPANARGLWGGILWLFARWGGAFSPLIFGAILRGLASPTWRRATTHLPGLSLLSGVPSWRIGFGFSGLVGLLWVAFFIPWFRDDPAEHRGVNAAELELIRAGGAETSRATAHPRDSRVWLALFSSSSLWALAVLYFFGSFGWSFFVSWVSRFFEEVHHVKFENSEIMSGLPLFVDGLSCLAGGFLSDWLVRRTGRHRLARAIFPISGCTIAATAMLGMRFARTPNEATALFCIAAAAYDFGQAANWASIVDIGGIYAATAAGFINMIGNIGNFAQPPIGRAIFHHLGWNALFGFYAGAYLIAGSMWFIVNPEKRFYEKSGELPILDG